MLILPIPLAAAIDSLPSASPGARCRDFELTYRAATWAPPRPRSAQGHAVYPPSSPAMSAHPGAPVSIQEAWRGSLGR